MKSFLLGAGFVLLGGVTIYAFRDKIFKKSGSSEIPTPQTPETKPTTPISPQVEDLWSWAGMSAEQRDAIKKEIDALNLRSAEYMKLPRVTMDDLRKVESFGTGNALIAHSINGKLNPKNLKIVNRSGYYTLEKL